MRRTLPLLLLLAAPGLVAQDITGGLFTGLSLPVGDLKDKSGYGSNQFFGAHLGGHLDFRLPRNHEVRGVLTYQDFPGSDWGFSKNHYTMLQAGADWVYHFQSPAAGWHSIAGASLNSVKDDWNTVTGTGRWISGSASQSGKLGVRGGAGYTFNRTFSLEGTLNQVFVDKTGADGFGFDTATWLQVSAVWRFGR